MIALVTGATGFIGSHLVESLLARGFTVRVLIRSSSDLRWLDGLQFEQVTGDIRLGQFPQGALDRVDYVFHLAGVIEATRKKDYFDINRDGTRKLLEAVRSHRRQITKFVFVSSQAAGGPSTGNQAIREDDPPHPVSFYGESKLAAEAAVLEFAKEFPVVILRPPTIYGPRETRVLAAFRMMKQGLALAAGSEPKYISFCYVSDLVKAMLQAALQSQPDGRIYNVCGEKAYEWLEFVAAIGRALGRGYRVFRIPKPCLFSLGAAGEIYSRLTGRSTLFTWQKVKEFAQNSWVIDGRRIRAELGWREEVDLEEGIITTLDWYRRQGWL